MYIFRLLGLILLLALAACNDSSSPSPSVPQSRIVISTDAAAWSILYSKGLPDHPSPEPGGWSFDFPVAPGSVHYVTTPVSGNASGQLAVDIEVTTTGAPFFDWHTDPGNTCDSPSTARLFMQRRGDDMAGTPGTTEFYRWWSNPKAYVLAAGGATLAVPLQPGEWSSVLGQMGSAAPLQFAAALADLGAVGLTFGGGCFFGHGVFVSGGTARFIVNGFRVE